MTKEEWYEQLFDRLEHSKFRSGFHLKKKVIYRKAGSTGSYSK